MQSDGLIVPSALLLKKKLLIGCLVTIAIGLLFWGASSSQDFPSQAERPVHTPLRRIIVIDIQGAVRNPGIQRYERSFDDPIRINEVITNAGGLSPEADQETTAKTLNLASEVSDGQKIYIPKMGDTAVLGSTSQKEMVNINSASIDELDSLKGIGAVRALQIIENRPFSSLDDFRSRSKLGTALIDAIADEITF